MITNYTIDYKGDNMRWHSFKKRLLIKCIMMNMVTIPFYLCRNDMPLLEECLNDVKKLETRLKYKLYTKHDKPILGDYHDNV